MPRCNNMEKPDFVCKFNFYELRDNPPQKPW